MTEQVQATEIQPVEQPVVEGYSFEEIAKEYEKQQQDPEKPAEAPVEAETVEGGEAEEQQQEQEAELEEKQAAPVEEKKRSKYVPRERFDEVYESAKREKEAAQRERERADKLAAFIDKLTQAEKKEEAPVEDDEPIDTATAKRVESLEKKLEQREFTATLREADSIGRKAFGESYDEANTYLIANVASEIMDIHGVSQDEAINSAMQTLGKRFQQAVNSGKSPEELAKLVYKTAQTRGYKGNASPAKAVAEAPAKVNIKALERARVEGGAPAVERASVKVTSQSWNEGLAAKAKDTFGKGDAKYLEKWGIA